MRPFQRYAAIAVTIILTSMSAVLAQSPSLSKFRGYDTDRVESETGRYWIFFKDKDRSTVFLKRELEGSDLPLSERSIRRRVMRAHRETATMHDLPVAARYIRVLSDSGIEIRTVSRLLNAVSVTADVTQLEWLDRLDFVREIKPVLLLKRKPIPVEPEWDTLQLAPTGSWQLDYGQSEGQLTQIRVPPLHEIGLSGAGVMIGVFDTGFRMDIPVISAIDIVAAYDFINDDPDVSDGNVSHGTAVLSIVGAAVSGSLYGPAYGATFVIAKTEDAQDEYVQEEDFFIAALEWADSIGCDIVTASLGYYDWYTFEDMDGNTAPVTIACDLAAAAGITVISSAGNQRSGFGHVTAPADGDSVIAVGAVGTTGIYASFSSPGPTYDGRIKPDICAQGLSVTAATVTGGISGGFSGTSASAPLVAGGIALLLEMHPGWGPIEVRSAIWMTGQHLDPRETTWPNNNYGYGVLDVEAASTVFIAAALVISPDSIRFSAIEGCPNPDSRVLEVYADGMNELDWSASTSSDWLAVEPLTGTTPATASASVDIAQLDPGTYIDTITFTSDSAINSPTYVRVRLDIAPKPQMPDEITVGPNPFEAWVEFKFPRQTTGSEIIFVFAVDGSKILEQNLPAGESQFRWAGINDSRNEVAAGIYLVKFTGFGDDRIFKVLKAY